MLLCLAQSSSQSRGDSSVHSCPYESSLVLFCFLVQSLKSVLQVFLPDVYLSKCAALAKLKGLCLQDCCFYFGFDKPVFVLKAKNFACLFVWFGTLPSLVR